MEFVNFLHKYIDFLEDKLYDEGYDYDDIKVLRYEFALTLNNDEKKYLKKF